MQTFSNILVFHPAAIGDAMLATPVSATLKLNFPGAKLTYWTHPQLKPILLGLCPAIDEVVDYNRDAGMLELCKTFAAFKCDLFVDLANSLKSHVMTWFAHPRLTLRYVKEPADARPIVHAVDNFLSTIKPICAESPSPLFPTIFPDVLVDQALEPFLQHETIERSNFIGIVPGVGKIRPHRAWLEDGWHYLLQHILEWKTHMPVLIGGDDEKELCSRLNDSVGWQCLDVSGKLTLPLTAAVLKRCEAVVSADTGPAHIAVAVGTKVIGLYGPTFPQRSGPYGGEQLWLDQSAACQCQSQKVCRFTHPDLSGECMRRIMLEEIIAKLKLAVSSIAVEEQQLLDAGNT
jgi:ADP-heptose:LPS heptosyltransferase